jgi:hypothetical protein
MTAHDTIKRNRKRRKRTRKLSDNKELLYFIIALVVCGLVLIGLLMFSLSSSGCRLPKFML